MEGNDPTKHESNILGRKDVDNVNDSQENYSFCDGILPEKEVPTASISWVENDSSSGAITNVS